MSHGKHKVTADAVSGAGSRLPDATSSAGAIARSPGSFAGPMASGASTGAAPGKATLVDPLVAYENEQTDELDPTINGGYLCDGQPTTALCYLGSAEKRRTLDNDRIHNIGEVKDLFMHAIRNVRMDLGKEDADPGMLAKLIIGVVGLVAEPLLGAVLAGLAAEAVVEFGEAPANRMFAETPLGVLKLMVDFALERGQKVAAEAIETHAKPSGIQYTDLLDFAVPKMFDDFAHKSSKVSDLWILAGARLWIPGKYSVDGFECSIRDQKKRFDATTIGSIGRTLNEGARAPSRGAARDYRDAQLSPVGPMERKAVWLVSRSKGRVLVIERKHKALVGDGIPSHRRDPFDLKVPLVDANGPRDRTGEEEVPEEFWPLAEEQHRRVWGDPPEERRVWP